MTRSVGVAGPRRGAAVPVFGIVLGSTIRGAPQVFTVPCPLRSRVARCFSVGAGAGDGSALGAANFSSTMVEPACGVSGAWGTCAKQTLGCVENKVEDRVMGCH